MRASQIQNTVVQSTELKGNRCGTGKRCQNSQGTGIAKLAGAAPFMEATLYLVPPPLPGFFFFYYINPLVRGWASQLSPH